MKIYVSKYANYAAIEEPMDNGFQTTPITHSIIFELQNYHFPYYPAEPLVKRAPRLDSEGIDLVSKFLLYEARKRVSAREAMHHPYFASLGTGVHNLLDGKNFFL